MGWKLQIKRLLRAGDHAADLRENVLLAARYPELAHPVNTRKRGKRGGKTSERRLHRGAETLKNRARLLSAVARRIARLHQRQPLFRQTLKNLIAARAGNLRVLAHLVPRK